MADIFPLSGTATVSTSTCSSINNRATSTTTASNCAGANTNKTVTAHGSAAAKALEMSPPSSAGQQAQILQALKFKCPRCDSLNTKFCYYNNYSLSQPRHFCKACKRYWTRGGTLRNVPVGGGCRKNKRVYHSPPLPPVSSNKMPCSSLLASCRNPSSTKEAPLTMIPSPLPTLPIADAVRPPPSSTAFIDSQAQHEARLSQLPQPLPSTTDHCSLQQRRPIKKIQQYSNQSPVELRLQEFGNFGMINDVIFNSNTMGLDSTSTSDWQIFNHINESGDQYSSYDLLLKRTIACWPDAAGQWSFSAHLI